MIFLAMLMLIFITIPDVAAMKPVPELPSDDLYEELNSIASQMLEGLESTAAQTFNKKKQCTKSHHCHFVNINHCNGPKYVIYSSYKNKGVQTAMEHMADIYTDLNDVMSFLRSGYEACDVITGSLKRYINEVGCDKESYECVVLDESWQ